MNLGTNTMLHGKVGPPINPSFVPSTELYVHLYTPIDP